MTLGELLTRPAASSCWKSVGVMEANHDGLFFFLSAIACYYSTVKIQVIFLLQQDSEWLRPPVSCLHLLVTIAQSRYNLFACYYSRTTKGWFPNKLTKETVV
jgi:hypothetical protein